MTPKISASSQLTEGDIQEELRGRPLPIGRIARFLHSRYGELTDAEDLRTKKREQQISHVLSRELAAHAVASVCEFDPEDAAACVVDGGQDLGVDAIALDTANQTCWIFQSKFSHSGTGCISEADFHKFSEGFGRVVRGDLERANPKILGMSAGIRAAIDDPRWKFAAVLVSTSNCVLSDESADGFRSYLAIADLGTGTFSFDVLHLQQVLESIDRAIDVTQINLTIELFSFGFITDPVYAVYGQVPVATVLDWKPRGAKLFQRNVRNFIRDSDVSASIARTLANNSDQFWYLNNGATILCDKISQAGVYSLHQSQVQARFECTGVTVVNGAQTIGAIWEHSGEGENLDPRARMHLRLISLANAAPNFAEAVTTATNTQKNILARDFAAQRPEQRFLWRQFQLDGKTYQIREGDSLPDAENGCTFHEAAVALACRKSLQLSVIAYRNVGFLTDPDHPDYRSIFIGNSEATAHTILRLVKILRVSEKVLYPLRTTLPDKADQQVATHAFRYVQHRVFRDRRVEILIQKPLVGDAELAEAVAARTEHYFRMVRDYLQANHPTAYLTTFFKNAQRVAEMDAALTETPEESSRTRQQDLSFGGTDANSLT